MPHWSHGRNYAAFVVAIGRGTKSPQIPDTPSILPVVVPEKGLVTSTASQELHANPDAAAHNFRTALPAVVKQRVAQTWPLDICQNVAGYLSTAEGAYRLLLFSHELVLPPLP